MIKFSRLRFNPLQLTAMGSGCFVGGTMAAEPLSRMHIDVPPSVIIVTIFIAICALIVVFGFRK